MNWTRFFARSLPAGCLAAALATSSALGQDEPIEVRVRAIAGPDGKVQVIEEKIVGKEADKGEKQETAKGKYTEKKTEEGKTGENKNEERPLRARIIRGVQELGQKVIGTPEGETLDILTEDFWGEMPQSDYWIGVQIAPVSPEVRKHIPVKHGVLVVQVYPDSPALKAELKADDILLQAGDAKIETGPDLVKAVDAAKATELSFIVLRGGKEMKVSVTPTKRDDENRATLTRTPLPRMEKLQAAQKQFEQALEALRAETQPQGTVDFMLVRPGAFLAHSYGVKLPDDLTVQITREGSKPAKINVKKGDKSWEATGDKLDALPKDIRPYVEQMLHGAGVAFTDTAPRTFQLKVPPPVTTTVPSPYNPGIAAVPALPALPGAPAVPTTPATPPIVARAATAWSHAIAPHTASDAKLDQILKKLDALSSPDLEAMKQELKALRKEVDELRKKSVDR